MFYRLMFGITLVLSGSGIGFAVRASERGNPYHSWSNLQPINNGGLAGSSSSSSTSSSQSLISFESPYGRVADRENSSLIEDSSSSSSGGYSYMSFQTEAHDHRSVSLGESPRLGFTNFNELNSSGEPAARDGSIHAVYPTRYNPGGVLSEYMENLRQNIELGGERAQEIVRLLFLPEATRLNQAHVAGFRNDIQSIYNQLTTSTSLSQQEEGEVEHRTDCSCRQVGAGLLCVIGNVMLGPLVCPNLVPALSGQLLSYVYPLMEVVGCCSLQMATTGCIDIARADLEENSQAARERVRAQLTAIERVNKLACLERALLQLDNLERLIKERAGEYPREG